MKSYCFDSRCALAVASSGLEVGSDLSFTSSGPVETVSTVSKDATLCLRAEDERMAEHAVAIVLLMIILRAQKVIVVLAIDRLANDRRGWPLGPGSKPGESERTTNGVGQ